MTVGNTEAWGLEGLGWVLPDSVTNHFTLSKSLHLFGLQSCHYYANRTRQKVPFFLLVFSVILCVDFSDLSFFPLYYEPLLL